MTTVSACEAKNHLSQLLDRVAQGEQVIISRHGVPVAIMQPVPAVEKEPPEEAIAWIDAFRKKHFLNGLSIRAMIEEGRA